MSNQQYDYDFSDLSDAELKELMYLGAEDMQRRGLVESGKTIYLPRTAKQPNEPIYTEDQMADTLRDYADLWANGSAMSTLLAFVEGAAGLVGDPLRAKLGLSLSSSSLRKLPLTEQEQLNARSNIGGELSKALHNTLAAAYKISKALGDETKSAFFERANSYVKAIQAVNQDEDNGDRFAQVINAFDPDHSGVAAITARYLLPGRKKDASDKAQVKEVIINQVQALMDVGKSKVDAINQIIGYYEGLESGSKSDLAIKSKVESVDATTIGRWISDKKQSR